MGIIKLDMQDFPSLFQRAKELYEHRTNEVLRDSDPVFTLLETQVMLIDMLNYYMESITEKQKKQHQHMRNAHVITTIQRIYLYLQSSYATVYQKSRVYDKQLFTFTNGEEIYYAEAMHDYPLFPFDICHTVMVQHGVDFPVQMILDNHTTSFHSQPLQEQDALYLCVEQHLPMQEKLYLSVLCDSSMRNQKGNPQLFKTEWKWEYYSMHGWQELNELDDTCGLRYTGEISFTILKHMDKTTLFDKHGFWVRAVKQHVMEKACLHIKDIRFHYVLCTPGITLAMSEEFVNTSKIPLKQAFESHVVFGKYKEDTIWNPCEDSIQQRDGIYVSVPKQPYEMYRIVYHRAQLMEAVETCSITGSSSQSIALPQAENLRIALASDEKLRDCPIYQDHQVFSSVIGAVQEDHGLRFGNGRDFLIPEAHPHGLWILDMKKNTVWENKGKRTILPKETGCTVYHIEEWEHDVVHEALLTNEQVKQFVKSLDGCMFTKVEVKDTDNGYHIVVKGIDDDSFDAMWLQKVEALVEQNLCYGCNVIIDEMIKAENGNGNSYEIK